MRPNQRDEKGSGDLFRLARIASYNLGATVGRAEIVRGKTGKWKKTFTPRQREKIEAIACATLRLCGYEVGGEVVPRRVPPILMSTYKILDGANLLRTNRDFRPHVALRFYWNYRKITSV